MNRKITNFALIVLMVFSTISASAAQIYFQFKDGAEWWGNDGAKIGAIFRTGTTSSDFGKYTTFFTPVSGQTNMYEAAIPVNEEAFKSVQFLRFSSTATKVDWADLWNTTGIITYDGSKNLFIANASGTDWDSTTGIWSSYNPTPGPTPTVDGVTLYFKRPAGWTETPHIHVWQTQEPVAGSRVIYELNVLNYSSAGSFNAVTNDMARLKALGVDVLWIMPIFPIGQKGKVGTYGSPYAIKDYYSVNPNYGSLADFKNLVNAAHTNGMEVWLDIACNHTATDCAWVNTKSVYYGYNPYHPEGWNDVYKLDYNYGGKNTELYTEMKNVLKYWVKECNIDGYRCDFATGVPVAFWNEARAAVSEIKQITWLGEAEDNNYWSGFDIQYGWNFHDMMVKFAGDRSVANLWTDCSNYFNSTKNSAHAKMTHLTNHDRSAYEKTEFERFGEVYNPLLVLIYTINDYPMIYMGQEIGWSVTTFTDKQAVNFNVKSETADFYRNLMSKLISLKHSAPALKDGADRGSLTRLYTNNDGSVLAYVRKSGDSSVVVVLNFSNGAKSVTLNSAPSGTYADFIDGGTRQLSGTISVGAYGYKVFVK